MIARRAFLKYTAGFAAFGFFSGSVPRLALAGDDDIDDGSRDYDFDLDIVDVDVEMIDGSTIPMYAFADKNGNATIPGPVLRVQEGKSVRIKVRNESTVRHGFKVFGHGSTAAIPSIDTDDGDGDDSLEITFTAGRPGTYVYGDPLRGVINRVLGLHGAFIVEPADGFADAARNKPMPYAPADATGAIKALFGALGETTVNGRPGRFPGHHWHPSRQYIWMFNGVDPNLARLVAAGDGLSSDEFVARNKPRHFTINGLSGIDSCHADSNCPTGHVGEPALIRCINVGVAAHSPHIHGNHVFLLAQGDGNGTPALQASLREHDVWLMPPMGIKDVLLPFTAPPDLPPAPWKMVQEKYPLRYPMHCHNEISQTSAGGSYPMGMVTDWHIDGPIRPYPFSAIG